MLSDDQYFYQTQLPRIYIVYTRSRVEFYSSTEGCKDRSRIINITYITSVTSANKLGLTVDKVKRKLEEKNEVNCVQSLDNSCIMQSE